MMRLKRWVKAVLLSAALAPCAALVFLQDGFSYPIAGISGHETDIEEQGREENFYSLNDWQTVNPDVCYVLHIDGIMEAQSLPVLSTLNPQDALDHDLLGRKDPAGAIFIDRSEQHGENKVIYGHASVSENTRFTFLKQFRDAAYFDAYSRIELETASGIEHYRIVSFAAYDLQQRDIYTGWADSDFEEGGSEKMFQETVPYLLWKRNGILYDGGGILTLVTCAAGSKDTRYVLQAVRDEITYG